MTYDTTEARQELLDTIADATEAIARALADVGAAHEQLDENSAETLEDELFRPLQKAYGRARRTHSGFAERFGFEGRDFEPAHAGPASLGARGLLERAVEAAEDADAELAELQDSMRPVDVGDAELRAGLTEVRALLGQVPIAAHRFVRLLGR